MENTDIDSAERVQLVSEVSKETPRSEFKYPSGYTRNGRRYHTLLVESQYHNKTKGCILIFGLEGRLGGSDNSKEHHILIGKVRGYNEDDHDALLHKEALLDFLATHTGDAQACWMVPETEEEYLTQVFVQPPYRHDKWPGEQFHQLAFVTETIDGKPQVIVRGLIRRSVLKAPGGEDVKYEAREPLFEPISDGDLRHEVLINELLGPQGYKYDENPG